MRPDLVCLSHLRWDFVYQRPNHLMSRAALDRRVFFVEEPLAGPGTELRISTRDGVHVLTPLLAQDDVSNQRQLLDRLLAEYDVARPDIWFYTPMATRWADHVPAGTVVYDCMADHLLPAMRVRARPLPERLTDLPVDDLELVAAAPVVIADEPIAEVPGDLL